MSSRVNTSVEKVHTYQYAFCTTDSPPRPHSYVAPKPGHSTCLDLYKAFQAQKRYSCVSWFLWLYFQAFST